jgi:hypothetical protein
MADRTLTIDIPDDDLEGIADAGNQDRPQPKDGGKQGDGADAGIEALKTQVSTLTQERDDDRKKAEDAERRRQQAEADARRERQDADRARREAESARTDGVDAQRVAIDNAIAAAQASADNAESEYATAFEAGDAKKVAAAQRRIAKAEAELAQLNAGKAVLADQPARTARSDRSDDRSRPAKSTTEQERIDAYIGQFTPSAQEWLRRHVECVTDKSKNYMAIAAHNEAMAQGHQQDTQAYWSFIDRKMGYDGGTEDDDGGASTGRASQQRQQPHQDGNGSNGMAASRKSAPVRGSNGSGAGGRSTSVDLTLREQQMATDGTIVWNTGALKGEPIGVKEYARRKLAMAKEGRFETPYAS